MSNPIDNDARVNRGLVSGKQTGTAQKPDHRGAEQAAADGHMERADASSQSDRLQAMRQAVDNTADVDKPRVEALRERIAKGDYPLDPERIAERFADFEQLLTDD